MSVLLAPFAVRALVAVAVVGLVAPVVGSFLVQRRLALIGDGVGHLAFAGVALGLVFGISPMWGALAAALLGAIGLERLRTTGRIASDISLALIFYGGIAAGVVGLSALNRFDASAIGVLFGSVLTATWGEVVLMVVISVLACAAAAFFYRPLLAVSLDEETARAAGLPVDALNLLLVLLTALLVAAGMRAVGLLLVSSLLVIPVAAGSRLAHSFFRTIAWASLVGLVSSLAGLAFALLQGTVAPGGAIVIAALIAFTIAVVVGRGAARHHPAGTGR